MFTDEGDKKRECLMTFNGLCPSDESPQVVLKLTNLNRQV